MKLSVDSLTDNREWRAVTGFSKSQFNTLLAHFEHAYLTLFGTPISQRAKRSPHHPTLTTYSDLLLFTLFSLKSGLTYDNLGFVCGMNRSNANRNQRLGLQVLNRALHDLGLLPVRKFGSPESFFEYFETHKILILDGTEQSVERPQDAQEQREHYSGKKKSHVKSDAHRDQRHLHSLCE